MAVPLIPPAATEAVAMVYLDESRVITNAPQSATERFNFKVDEGTATPCFDLTIRMTQGRAELRIRDPAGRERVRMGAQKFNGKGQSILPAKARGDLGRGLASGALMILVAVAFVWFWRRREFPGGGSGGALQACCCRGQAFHICPSQPTILQGLKASCSTGPFTTDDLTAVMPGLWRSLS